MTLRQWTILALIAALIILAIAETVALRDPAAGDTISEITRDQFAKLGTFALAGLCAICFGIGMLVFHLLWWQSAPTNADAASTSLHSLDP
jgi:Zn-dependent protease with chaperone function